MSNVVKFDFKRHGVMAARYNMVCAGMDFMDKGNHLMADIMYEMYKATGGTVDQFLFLAEQIQAEQANV